MSCDKLLFHIAANVSFGNGLSRQDYNTAMDHVITKRFPYMSDEVDFIKFEYTNWTNIEDRATNRDEYIQVGSICALFIFYVIFRSYDVL